MSDDRSTRNIFAVFLLLAALFTAMNRVVESAPVLDWWLPLVLFVVGVALVFIPSFHFLTPPADVDPDAVEKAQLAALPAQGVHTYHVSAEPAPRLHTMTIRPDPDTAQYELVSVTEETPSAEGVLPFAETETVAQPATPDDLTRISGIGPKSSAALKAAGIDSFHKLSTSSDEVIRAALSDAGVRLVGDSNTWPQQAAFAARGDWDGLRQFNTQGKAPATGD